MYEERLRDALRHGASSNAGLVATPTPPTFPKSIIEALLRRRLNLLHSHGIP